jgi:hypothetical protein
MKKMIALISLLIAISSFAQAAELCGILGSHAVGPQCVVGEPCPHWIGLRYDLRLADGRRVDLETANPAVLQDFGTYLGQNVCVEGSQASDGKFEVTSIR